MKHARTITTCCLLTVATVLLIGCAGGSRSADHRDANGRSGTFVPSSSSRSGDAGALEQRAAAERSSRPRTIDVPLPPGLEPNTLALRSADDPNARLTLAQALDALAPPTPAAAQQQHEGIDDETSSNVPPDQQAAALKAYAKGRSAALDNRHLQAVIEYQKALAIDPESPQVLREIARSYDASGNQQRAYEMLERLIRVAPDDADALYALGVAAATRREFAQSIDYLGRLSRSMSAEARDGGLAVIVDFTLATSLRELGYDRAFVEMARRVVDMSPRLAAASPSSRIASVYRQRGDVLRSVGDAHARLGELAQAIDAWTASATLPSADPTALQPRLVYANLRINRPHNAQLILLDAMRESAAAGSISDREVRLCAYVAQHAQPINHLATEVLALQSQHPDDGGLVRAAAMLLDSDDAMALLRDFVERRPDDRLALQQMFEWLLRDDADAAAALAISLAKANPARADDYSDALSQSTPGFSAAIRIVQAQPASPAQAAVFTRVLMRAGSLGRAWSVCQSALKQWPDDRSLRLRAVELAAAMQEPALVQRAIAACADLQDVLALITLSQARRSLAHTQAALELAQRAAALDADNVDAQIELARAHYAHATILAGDQATILQARSETQSAIAAADRAIAMDPMRDEAFEVLTLIYGPNGVLADGTELRDVIVRLRQSNPSSPLYNRIAAQEAIAQRRFDQALERLINAYDGNPNDGAALSLVITTWERAGDLDRAEAWLREKLAQRPGDASLREQLLRVLFLSQQQQLAISELEQQAEADEEDWTARRLLESAYRLTGQTDAALRLGEQRFLERPEGVRREIELAGLYVGAERAVQALEHIERVRELAADASIEDLTTAMALASRVQGEDARRDALTLDLAHIGIERDPTVPLQVYGFAIRAIARQEIRSDSVDPRFDALVREAVANSRGAHDTSFVGARLWQELAQALVAENLVAAAGRVLRVRLAQQPLFEDAAFGALARVVIVIDAETAYQAGPKDIDAADRIVRNTISTLRDMQDRNLLARVFELQGQIDLPLALYESSVIYTLVGAEAGSEAIMRESLRIKPEDAMTLNNLGYMLLERGESTEEVVRMIHDAGRLEPDEANILDTVGWLRYKQNQLSDDAGALPNAGDARTGAITLIQRALDVSTDPSPEVLDHLGDARWRMGDEEGATQAWRRVVGMLDDGTFRERLVQNVAIVQARQWGIIVMDGQRMYDREYEPILRRAREKLAAAARGEQPVLAPQWGEGDQQPHASK